MQNLKNFMVEEEEGQGLVEYGLIVVLIGLAAFAVVKIFGGTIKNIFSKGTEKLSGDLATIS